MSRDSVLGTFVVAGVLCVVCSVIVSWAAEGLKAKQEENQAIDKKKNVLLSASLCEPDASAEVVNEIFANKIREVTVDLQTGDVLSQGEVEEEYGQGYDAEKAAKNSKLQVAIEPPDALMGIRFRAPAAPVYKIVEGGTSDGDGKVEGYIFPVEGKGLWSTLMGFLALEADGQTVRGITFYKHAETPGLGGEVDNPNWKSTWMGKKVYGEDGEVSLDVVKGSATNDYQVDGLSGATITSKGVDHLVDYWLGKNGFGPYIAQIRNDGETKSDLHNTES